MSYNEEFVEGVGQINYWLPIEQHQFNSNKILAFDLDWTLIKPKSNKKLPIDYNDWIFLFEDKLSLIKQYLDNGYKFIILSNQAIINKGHPYNHNQFKQKWDKIYKELNKVGIYSVYLLYAIKDDFMRKPCKGMWDYFENKLNGNENILYKESLYVGDAAGRPKDHASTDLKLILNINNGLEFKTPENFFLNNKTDINNTEKLIEILNDNNDEFNPWKYVEKLSLQQIKLPTQKKSISMLDYFNKSNKEVLIRLKEIIKSNDKTCIIFIGSPSSTKSTFYNDYLKDLINKKNDSWLYTSLDTLNYTMAKYIKYLGEQFKKGYSCIIDNTNPDIKTREKIIHIARSNNVNKIISIYFDIDKSVVFHLNKMRTKKINANMIKDKDPVPTVAINTYYKKYEPINIQDENIDEYIEWKFIPNINDDKTKNDVFLQYLE